MITAIIILSLLSIKDELVGIIDLYSTLQGNLIVYAINAFITTVSGMLEVRYISVYEGTWTEYFILTLVVSIVASIAGTVVVHNKKKLKELLRKKKISKTMKKKWEEKKSIAKEAIDAPVQPDIETEIGNVSQGDSKGVPEGDTRDRL